MVRAKKTIETLFKRQAVLIVLLAAILVESISLIQYFYSKHELRKEADGNAQTEIDVVRLEVEMVTSTVENSVLMITPAIEYNLTDMEYIYQAIQHMLNVNTNIADGAVAFVADYFPTQGHWYELLVARREGGTLERMVLGGPDHDYLNAEWYISALRAGLSNWSEPYYDESGGKSWVITCTSPLYDMTGAVAAILGADLKLEWIDALADGIDMYPGSFSQIISRNGTVLAGSDTPESTDGLVVYENMIEKTGWTMRVYIPEEEIYSEVKKVGLLTTILQLLGLALLIFIIQRTARGQMKIEAVQAGKEKIESELKIARGIQMSMIPKIFPPFPERHDLDMYASLTPAKEVGGDLYDFYIRDEKLFFCIGDVSGKGVPASLVMAVTRSLFRTVSAHETSPKRIVTNMNESMSEVNENNMFVTFFCGVLDLSTGHLRYCNAGHNAPVALIGHKHLLEVVPNLPLGIMAGMKFTEQEIDMHFDDALFLYTDGLTEAENNSKDLFGEDRMFDVLHIRRSAEAQLNAMKDAVNEFVGSAPRSDDLTMLFIHYLKDSDENRNVRHLVMHNNINEISRLVSFVEEISDEKNLDPGLSMSLNLALEEAVTNVVLYAYPENVDGLVELEATLEDNAITFVLKDSGKAFDPTLMPEADITLGVDERKIGGLGIHLVRTIMDEVRYQFLRNRNILTMKKNI